MDKPTGFSPAGSNKISSSNETEISSIDPGEPPHKCGLARTKILGLPIPRVTQGPLAPATYRKGLEALRVNDDIQMHTIASGDEGDDLETVSISSKASNRVDVL